jgi:hypothetical protein
MNPSERHEFLKMIEGWRITGLNSLTARIYNFIRRVNRKELCLEIPVGSRRNMGAYRVQRLTTWEILFALSLPADNTIYSKVRLNKTLALLQRDGFPIKNRFINEQMGPFDGNVHSDAEILAENGLIEISEKPTGKGSPCVVYKMKADGLRALHQKYSDRIENLPHQKAIRQSLEEIKRNFVSYKTAEIVDRVHKDLLIDCTPQEFKNAVYQHLNLLRSSMTHLESRWDDGCPVCLEVLGAVDFAIRSLESVFEKELSNKESGKNMIFYNAKQVLQWAEKSKSHNHVTDVRLQNDQLSLWREWIGHRLSCLESIGETYEIIKPVKDEESLGEYIEMVGS